MQKFEASYPDLKAELVTLEGETILLEPKEKLTSKRCAELIDQMDGLSRKYQALDEKTTVDAMALGATQLALLYPQDLDWFQDNLDPGLLRQLLMYCTQELGGLSKK